MKSLITMLAAACCAAGSLPAQTASAARATWHQVYVLPMPAGLDQYLADWLTRERIAQVVTDPKTADLVMTDRLGEAFEQQLAAIRPAPPKKPVEKPAEDKKDDKADKTVESAGASSTGHLFRSSAVRGNIFLVDIKSGKVVWSDHEAPQAASDSNLNREAERVARKLHEASLP